MNQGPRGLHNQLARPGQPGSGSGLANSGRNSCPLVHLGRTTPTIASPEDSADCYELYNQRERKYYQHESRSITQNGTENYHYVRNESCRSPLDLTSLPLVIDPYWEHADYSKPLVGGKCNDGYNRKLLNKRIVDEDKRYAIDNYKDQGYDTLLSPTSSIFPRNSSSNSFQWTDCSDSNSKPWWSTKPQRQHGTCLLQHINRFDQLSDDLVVKVFSYLNSSDLSTCARVCQRFLNLVWTPRLWQTIQFQGDNICGDKAVRGVLRQLCGQAVSGACTGVEKVYLSDGVRISDKGLNLLARRCPQLSHLQLHGCIAVTNNMIGELTIKCVNLQHLDLTACTQISCLSSPGMVLRRLQLQYLNLTDCTALDDNGLTMIVRSCPQLAYLYLRRCIQITDASFKFVPNFCAGLREISVSDCTAVTDFGLYELARLGATLRYLSVAKCERISDAGLKAVARRCYKLRYLNARGCEAVSDDAVSVLARCCPRLRALDLGKCDVSDAGLRALAECCPNLKKLGLRNCDLVTDRGVQCIAYYCRGLQQLNIQDCQISLEGYRAVKKYCKRCVIEHTNPGFC